MLNMPLKTAPSALNVMFAEPLVVPLFFPAPLGPSVNVGAVKTPASQVAEPVVGSTGNRLKAR
ncbi:MAG: hypothetical protein WKG52_18510 [Variovorax sp.]